MKQTDKKLRSELAFSCQPKDSNLPVELYALIDESNDIVGFTSNSPKDVKIAFLEEIAFGGENRNKAMMLYTLIMHKGFIDFEE